MRDYKHLAKKPAKKHTKLVLIFFGTLVVIYGYHFFDALSGWLQKIEVYSQSEPFALFPVILIALAIVMIGGGATYDIIWNHFRKKTRGMATKR